MELARTANIHRRKLTAYGILTYVALVVNVAGYPIAAPPGDWRGQSFAAGVTLTYSAIYLAPVVAPVAALSALRLPFLAAAMALVGASLAQASIFADRFLFQIYGFHLNGFVWNLVTTRGGIESLGSGADTVASFAAIAAAFLALQAGLYWAAGRAEVSDMLAPLRRWRAVLVAVTLFLALGLGERAG